MDYIQLAQLDNVCPHPIESKELLEWAWLWKLERDFALFRDETIWLFDAESEVELKMSKELAEKKSRELADIFVVPAEARETAKEIIDIRLCAYIRALEFILLEIRGTSSRNIWTGLMSSLHKSPSIFESFEHADDTPEVRWLFKNRIMTYFIRLSLIQYWAIHEYPRHLFGLIDKCPYRARLHEYFSRLIFLKNCRFYIDKEDCYVIMKDIILPQLERIKHECRDCDGKTDLFTYWLLGKDHTYLAVMQSLIMRHEGVLKNSIHFFREKSFGLDGRYEAKRPLYLLLRVAHDRDEWEIINFTLSLLLSSPPKREKASAIGLLGKLVEWNKSQEGTSLEMLSEHFDIMIELLESSSDEIREANHFTWRCIAGLIRLKEKSYQMLRASVSIYLRGIDKLTQEKPEEVRKAFETLYWLMMPRVNAGTSEFDVNSASNQLFEDLKLMAQKVASPNHCDLKSVYSRYRNLLKNPELMDQFDLICVRASWLFVKHFSSENSRDDSWGHHVTSAISGIRKSLRPRCLSLAIYLNYCNLLMEINHYFYDPEQILEPQRCLWFLRVLEEVGPSGYNEEKSRATGSCLLKAIEIHPRQIPQIFHKKLEILEIYPGILKPSSRRIQRLYPLKNQPGAITCSSDTYQYDDETRGIQSRRMLIISLCKCLISGSTHAMMPMMVDLLSELELAYKLRVEQESSVQDIDFSLVPTCVELAFPTPFDHPNNPMYICEFAYFRDTMDYLRRNKPEQLGRVCSQFSRSERKCLEYYQNEYNKFDVCCSTKGGDKERDRFRCIKHDIPNQAEPRICPLLDRYQYCDHIKN